jgi:hypothetical protein
MCATRPSHPPVVIASLRSNPHTLLLFPFIVLWIATQARNDDKRVKQGTTTGKHNPAGIALY